MKEITRRLFLKALAVAGVVPTALVTAQEQVPCRWRWSADCWQNHLTASDHSVMDLFKGIVVFQEGGNFRSVLVAWVKPEELLKLGFPDNPLFHPPMMNLWKPKPNHYKLAIHTNLIEEMHQIMEQVINGGCYKILGRTLVHYSPYSPRKAEIELFPEARPSLIIHDALISGHPVTF